MEPFHTSKWGITGTGQTLCEQFLQDAKSKKKIEQKQLKMRRKRLKLKSGFAIKNETKETQKLISPQKSKTLKKAFPDIQKLNDNITSLLKTKVKMPKNAKKIKDKKGACNVNPGLIAKRKRQLAELQAHITNDSNKKNNPDLSLRQKMIERLESARFRFLNEQIYTVSGKEAEKIFKTDPEAFHAYHKGYQQQVSRWPMNPLDRIIKSISKLPKGYKVSDFGCGEAKLSQSLEHTVHSFDLVAVNKFVTPCNMAHVPLENYSMDVAVFCLSLMGINLSDYLIEANRVLKVGGMLKIAEVASRFDDVNQFIANCKYYGFKKTWMDLSHNLFYFIDFRKESDVKNIKKLPKLSLKPCIYKRR
ncbi:uncharacterized protein LOC132701532 isoform X2 [Cylas formicarius]|nr:uncharacterized protein LOC132701532 isoform X2 [Cylas formicarius]